jgi:KDO2-lipid IV(A) lauroyltransferase
MGRKNPTPKYYLEYLALRGLTAFFSFLPYRAALSVGWLFARFAFHVVRYRRAEAEARIREVFGDRFTAREVRQVAWISLRNFLFNGVELLRMRRVNRAWIERQVDHDEALAAIQTHLRPGRGLIVACPHMGNWELAGFGLQVFGLPVFSIAAQQHNPYTDRYLRDLRNMSGVEVLERGDVWLPLKVARNLEGGKILGFLPDVRAKREAIRVEFLGKPANIYGGMAGFARHAGAAILPSVATRIGWTRHRWRIFDAVLPDPSVEREADSKRITQQVMSAYDRVIREMPEQFFWYNHRWILTPLESDSNTARPNGR